MNNQTAAPLKHTNKRTIFSWCLYDWANSAFNTVIGTFIYSVFFARGIVGDEIHGSALWGYAIGAAGIGVAVLSPFLGSVADKTGHRKVWLFLFMMLTVLGCIALAFAKPDPSWINYVLLIVFLSHLAFEMSLVFYNSMLTTIAPPHMIGRISGWAWGLGYMGGLACLVVALFVLVGFGDYSPVIDFPTDEAQNVRASALLVALWFMVFSLPLLLFYHDKRKKDRPSFWQCCLSGGRGVIQTAKKIKSYKNIFLFLISSAFFRDGLATLFAVGGLYAAGTFDMSYSDILIFAVGLNITAGIGAFGFSFLDDSIGPKKTLILSLLGLIGAGVPILFINDQNTFMFLALFLGLFVGPAQAGGRSLMAQISPKEKQGEFFGFYALTGKSIAFIGPLLFGLLTDVFDSQRVGMSVVVGMITLGLILLLPVKHQQPKS